MIQYIQELDCWRGHDADKHRRTRKSISEQLKRHAKTYIIQDATLNIGHRISSKY